MHYKNGREAKNGDGRTALRSSFTLSAEAAGLVLR